ncbi:MAG: hypothetical protein M3Y18_09060 [Candidatus Eremiobacteraeota bacterium]|nr:hypothetical protein [Candidatus Eremiobacteraeota bacterium]
MVNLLVDLQAERFDEDALACALRNIESAGFEMETVRSAPDAFLAWIDERFGGTWSSEAFAGNNLIARRKNEFAAFAAFAPRGLTFAWLRATGASDDVGIFGPFGVASEFRGTPGLGPNILVGALALLRRKGYARALIPAVGEEALVAYYIEHAGSFIAERFAKSTWTSQKRRTVVLASGNGTNAQSVLDAATQGRLPLHVLALVSNVAEARALERAHAAGVEAVSIPWVRSDASRALYDRRLLKALSAFDPELVVLAGWMHVLDPHFVARFPDTINIHPAFLPHDQLRNDVGFPDGSVTPAYRGGHAIRDALRDGSAWTGATAHMLAESFDRGRVLVRKPLALPPGESEAAVAERLHPIEHRVLAGGIMRWVYER